jgi:hypothetical protein
VTIQEKDADVTTLHFVHLLFVSICLNFDIPIGPANDIEPGGPDLGQPTHFYPRRSPFLFTIHLPSDFAKGELIWTLTAHGRTEHAYASLKSDYQIDKQASSVLRAVTSDVPASPMRT